MLSSINSIITDPVIPDDVDIFEILRTDTEERSYLLGNLATVLQMRENETTVTYAGYIPLYFWKFMRQCVTGDIVKNEIVNLLKALFQCDDFKDLHFPITQFTNAFIRGIFDMGGFINGIERFARFDLPHSLEGEWKEKCSIPLVRSDGGLCFLGTNAVDFLGRIYDGGSQKHTRTDLRDMYITMIGYGNNVSRDIPIIKFKRVHPDAKIPTKTRVSDEGYDLWIIAIDKKVSSVVTRYTTGIAIQPPHGWHVEVIPRSSLSDTGYTLDVSLIDEGYRGSIRVPLVKVDIFAKELKLPMKVAQLVLRKSYHMLFEEEKCDLETTDRGHGGFGSTNIKE